MSKRAEQRALEAYPEDWWFANPGDWGIVKNPRQKDYNAEKRATFILGYKQAEKDLAPLIEAAMIVYEAWNGGTMDDVRRGMVELGKRFKEDEK